MDLALNNIQGLICHKPQQTNNQDKIFFMTAILSKYNLRNTQCNFQQNDRFVRSAFGSKDIFNTHPNTRLNRNHYEMLI